MKKFLGFILVVLIVLFAIIFIGRNQIAKLAVTKSVQKSLGLDMDIGKMDINLLKTKLGVNNVKVMNPPGFADPLMFDMPEMFVDYNLRNILAGKVHLQEIRLNIASLTAVRNKEGQLNLSVLQPRGSGTKKAGPSQPSQEPSGSPKDLNIQIDRASIKLGKLIFKDYTQGEQPNVQELNINLDETYEDVTDVQALMATIVQKAMMKSAFPNMEEDFKKMQEGFSKEAEDALKKLKENIKLPSF
jgi:uncharacterized protein involved in outer membrane biogenesis